MDEDPQTVAAGVMPFVNTCYYMIGNLARQHGVSMTQVQQISLAVEIFWRHSNNHAAMQKMVDSVSKGLSLVPDNND